VSFFDRIDFDSSVFLEPTQPTIDIALIKSAVKDDAIIFFSIFYFYRYTLWQPNGSALSCGADNFRNSLNEMSSH
jgi:hypothetical protein